MRPVCQINVIWFILMLMVSPVVANSQSQEKKYAIMMLNFAKGMQWPTAPLKGNFVVGVYEYPPLAAELNAYFNALKIGSQTIEVKEVGSPEEVNNCHMLFIPAYKTKRFQEILNNIGNRPVLIISNKADYAKKGAGINFILVNGILKYEINTKSVESRGLKISANVKRLGIPVE
jgi:hypothetical protein